MNKKKSIDKLLTAKQLAKMLDLSVATVYKFAQNKTIPALRIPGRLVRFHWQAVTVALAKYHVIGRTNRIPKIILNKRKLWK